MRHARRLLAAGAACLSLAAAGPAPAADPGSLEPAFGSGGRVVTGFAGRQAFGEAVVMRPDGSVVVGGVLDPAASGGPGPPQTALVQYRPDGTLDPSFGEGGRVVRTFGEASALSDLALQQDGKIVAAFRVVHEQGDPGLARFMPDGSLDTSFGSGGLAVRRLGTPERAQWPVAVQVQPDGRIVVLATDFTLMRFGSDGSTDPGFGTGGRAPRPFGPDGEPLSGDDLELLPGGAAVALGVQCRTEPCSVGLARYNAAGLLDPGFGSMGAAYQDRFNPSAVAVQPDGGYVVVGETECPREAPEELCHFVAMRFDAAGRIDEGFGQWKGRARLFADDQRLQAAFARADGRIVAAGGRLAAGGGGDALVTRLLPDGELDWSFGECGESRPPLGRGIGVEDVAAHPDGSFVVAGHHRAGEGSPNSFAALRYRGTGAHDPRGRPTLLLDPAWYEVRFADLRRDRATIPVRTAEHARVTVDLLLDRASARRLGVEHRVALASATVKPCRLRDVRLRLTAAGRTWLRKVNSDTSAVLRFVARNRAGERVAKLRLAVNKL